MKRFLLFLLALPLFATPPVVSSVRVDAISHSNARITFNVAGYAGVGSLDRLRLRYIKTSLGTCLAGPATGDKIQHIQYFPDAAPGFLRPSDMSLDLGGIEANTAYEACPETSNDGGTSYSVGAGITFTTQSLPAIHPALPKPVAIFDNSYPDTTGYNQVTTASDCSDLQSAIDNAQWSQSSNGTVINIPAGSVCNYGYGALAGVYQILFQQYALDLVTFLPADVVTGTPGKITLSPQPFVEGQMVQFGKHYADNSFSVVPSSSSCPFGNGLVVGAKYWVHIQDSTHISLFCSDDEGIGKGTTMLAFSDQGTGAQAFELAPFSAATSNKCPSTDGPKTCTYQARAGLFHIVVRSSAPDSLIPPDGVRTGPNWFASGLGVTLVNPVRNVENNGSDHAFVSFGAPDGNNEVMASKIHFGPNIKIINEADASFRIYTNMTVAGETSSNVVMDRVWLHGGGTPQRWGNVGFPANNWSGINFSFANSYIDNMVSWHADNSTDGSSTIMPRGVGPVMLYNNHIEGAGIPIHIDGEGGTVWLSGDASVIRNYFYCPLKYMHGSAENIADGSHWYGHRQPFEIKQLFRGQLAGNVYRNSWGENTGASVFNALTAVGGLSILDVNSYSNTFSHGPGVSNVTTLVDGGGRQNIPPNRFWFHNNLAYDINANYVATASLHSEARGWAFQGPASANEDVLIENNTIVGNTGSQPGIFFFQDANSEGVIARNNIFTVEATRKGAFIDGSVETNPCSALEAEALTACKITGSGNPYEFTHNVLTSTDGSTQATVQGWWPSTSGFVPSNMALTAIGWLSYDATGAGGVYGLGHSSPYTSSGLRGTNGHDLGVNYTQMRRDQGQVIVNDNPVSTLGTTTATVSFVAPDTQSCPVRVALTPWSPAVPTSGVIQGTDTGTRPGGRNVNLTGLASGTHYYGIVLCAVEQPTFELTTH